MEKLFAGFILGAFGLAVIIWKTHNFKFVLKEKKNA